MPETLTLLRDYKRSVLQTLVHMLWADGRMAPEQVDAIVAAAELLAEPDIGSLIVRRHDPAELSRGLAELPEALKPLLLTLAAWVAASDGRDHPAEQLALADLRRDLDLTPEGSHRLVQMARRMVRTARSRPNTIHLDALLRGAGHFYTPQAVA